MAKTIFRMATFMLLLGVGLMGFTDHFRYPVAQEVTLLGCSEQVTVRGGLGFTCQFRGVGYDRTFDVSPVEYNYNKDKVGTQFTVNVGHRDYNFWLWSAIVSALSLIVMGFAYFTMKEEENECESHYVG